MVGASTTGTGSDERADRRLSEVLVTLARLVLAGDDTGWLAREAVLTIATALDALYPGANGLSTRAGG